MKGEQKTTWKMGLGDHTGDVTQWVWKFGHVLIRFIFLFILKKKQILFLKKKSQRRYVFRVLDGCIMYIVVFMGVCA